MYAYVPLWLHIHHESIFPSQSAVGWDYQAQLAKHESQKDAAKGFGGRYGIQKERQDKVLADIDTCYLMGKKQQNKNPYVHNVQAMPLYLDHILYPEVRPCKRMDLVSFIVLWWSF